MHSGPRNASESGVGKVKCKSILWAFGNCESAQLEANVIFEYFGIGNHGLLYLEIWAMEISTQITYNIDQGNLVGHPAPSTTQVFDQILEYSQIGRERRHRRMRASTRSFPARSVYPFQSEVHQVDGRLVGRCQTTISAATKYTCRTSLGTGRGRSKVWVSPERPIDYR